MTTKRAGIYKDENGWVRVIFPFDVKTKDDLKRRVGSTGYKWVPAPIKCWFVLEPFAGVAAEVLEANGFEVETDIEEFLEAPVESVDANPWVTIFAQLDEDIGKKLWRSAALVLHPDKIGKNKLMTELNNAWRNRKND